MKEGLNARREGILTERKEPKENDEIEKLKNGSDSEKEVMNL